MSFNHASPLNPPTNPLLIVLSGLSGAGKDAVLKKMKEDGYPLEYVTTVTTRARRSSERDNVDYHFISQGEFQEMLQRNELLEHANVYGNWYGVPKRPVKQALDEGKDVVLKIDVQGATTIKKIMPQAVFIFLTPPSIEELAARLKQRQTESSADLELRLKTAKEEIKHLPLFDYIVLNRRDDIKQAAADVWAIITAEKLRVKQRKNAL